MRRNPRPTPTQCLPSHRLDFIFICLSSTVPDRERSDLRSTPSVVLRIQEPHCLSSRAMHKRVNSLLSSLLPKETTTATMSAPGSPTMLPRWAKVDKFSSLSTARKMILAGAAAVLTLFLVVTLSQAQSSPLRIGNTAHSDQPDPIDDVFNSTLGVSRAALLYTL